MTPLFGPKPAPPGIAFGPGYGERRPGGWRSPPDIRWPAPPSPAGPWQAGPWQAGPWQAGPWPGAGGWPHAPLDPFGQFQSRQGLAPTGFGAFGGFRR